jgi:hypothetical protein
VKTLRVVRKQPPLNGTVKEIRLGGQSVGANLPLEIETTLANFGDVEIKDLLVQLSIDGEKKEQKLTTIPPRGESTVSFQTRLAASGAHFGQVTLKKEGLAGNPAANFALDAQDKIKILVVDGDPQTSLVQSETFFLSRALNPAGEKDSSLFLPTVIVQGGLPAASLDSYQAVMLCNVASIPDAFLDKLASFLQQGGGVLIFAGDRVQADSYNRLVHRSPPFLPAELRDRRLGAESGGEKIDKIELSHPALQGFSDAILSDSVKSARVWGYLRTAAAGGTVLIALANGDPLLLERRVGAGRVMLMATSADRDWTDLPVKTAYLPFIQSLTSYLAGGKRGALDGGISVGAIKEISLPPGYVGKSLRVIKPNQQSAEVFLSGEKGRAAARIEDNDRAGIYRLSQPAGGDKESGAPQIYAVNPPVLESRLDEIGARELAAKLKPVPVEVIPVDALQQGGTRMDLALPLLALLIVTLLVEGWLAQRV